MAKALSMDIRERVVEECEAGEKKEEVAKRFKVSYAWVRKVTQRHRETGRIAPLDGKRGPKRKLEPHRELLKSLVEKNPDATLEEIREQLPVEVSISTLWLALKGIEMSHKKK